MKPIACIAVFGSILVGSVLAANEKAPAGLAFVSADLCDGTTWTLGRGGIGRPFMVSLVLMNDRDLTIWDYKSNGGPGGPGVILTDEKGKETVLQLAPIDRAAGIDVVIDLEPRQGMRIDLELLRLIGEHSLPPGRYTLKGLYENNRKKFGKKDLWVGRIESQPVAIVIVAPPAASR